MEQQPQTPTLELSKYENIGGWLILIGIGLIITIFRLGYFVYQDVLPTFTPENWSVLTEPGSLMYHELWAPLLIFELLGNVLFILLSGILLYLFFQKKRTFPKLYIIFLFSNLVFIVIDHFAGDLIPIVAEQNNSDSLKEMFRSVLACTIWIPYFLISKRVKGTFIN